MQRYVQFKPVSPRVGYSGAFELSFRYPDPYKAQRVTRKLLAQMIEGNILAMIEANKLAADEGALSTQAEVLDPASLPGQAIFPNRPFMIVVGLTAGLLLGCLYVARHSWRWLAPSA